MTDEKEGYMRAHGAKHRKVTTSAATRGRVATVALATGAVSVAGAGGAVAATATHANHSPSVELAAAPFRSPGVPSVPADAVPQILQITEYKPLADVTEQVHKAVKYTEERLAADRAARLPIAVRPAEGVLTSPFGSRWGVIHMGIDIANAIGTPIVAAMDGVVIDAGPASGFGNWVRILHPDGTITVYGHMETIDVTVGQRVTAGQRIAGMGSRGFSTGSHLHFEVHPNGAGPIDPIPWLAALGILL